MRSQRPPPAPTRGAQSNSAAALTWGPLQVPNFVAKRWKACCEQSVERGEATGRKLATLRLVKSTDETGAAKTEYQLQLDGACACL